jgi:hypothetical protein
MDNISNKLLPRVEEVLTLAIDSGYDFKETNIKNITIDLMTYHHDLAIEPETLVAGAVRLIKNKSLLCNDEH